MLLSAIDGRTSDFVLGGRDLDRPVESGEPLDERCPVGRPFRSVRLDGSQDLADTVDQRQQPGGDVGVESQPAVPEAGQQVLADMSDRLELGVAQEARGSLDRVDRPEDPRQLVGRRVLLQVHQFPVETVEVLVTLDQKLSDDLVHLVHSGDPFRRATGLLIGTARRNLRGGAQPADEGICARMRPDRKRATP
jgi:hypothetical protein